MAVTLGLMFRVDTNPPAVVVPVVNQVNQSNSSLVVDAVKEPSATSGAQLQSRAFQDRSEELLLNAKEQQPITYNQKGIGRLPHAGGQLLDTYV